MVNNEAFRTRVEQAHALHSYEIDYPDAVFSSSSISYRISGSEARWYMTIFSLVITIQSSPSISKTCYIRNKCPVSTIRTHCQNINILTLQNAGQCRDMVGPGEMKPLEAGTGGGTEQKDPDVLASRHKERVRRDIDLLKSDLLHFRCRAAEALGEGGDPEAVEPLIAALSDPFVDVGWLAAKSLGMLGDSRAVEPLIASLSSKEKWMRAGVAWALGRLKDRRAVDHLIPLLQDPKKMVRKNAAWALGEIGDERATGSLTGLLQDPDPEIRDTVQKALEAIQNKTGRMS